MVTTHDQIIKLELIKKKSDFLRYFPKLKPYAIFPIYILFALVVPKYGVLYFHRMHKILKLRSSIFAYLYYLLNYYLNKVDIGNNCDIGVDVKIPHPLAIVIGDTTVIGDNCIIMSCVTFGTNSAAGKHNSYPFVGNNCYIGTGAKIIGSITLGDNVVVGANSVVIKSVPSGFVVAGVPARPIKNKSSVNE